MILTVRLKQYTPIIHFQHDQKGATLRATELKPKLDSFLKKKYDIDPEKKIRYQVKIKYLRDPRIQQPPKGGLYFGNQRGSKEKWEVKGDIIEVKFNTYFDEKLMRRIKDTLPVCLALENFGTRNNKGYGCFFIEDKTINDFVSILKTEAPSKVYYWDCSFDEVFFSIKTVYALLKSGINLSLEKNPILTKEEMNKFKKDHFNEYKLVEKLKVIKNRNNNLIIDLKKIRNNKKLLYNFKRLLNNYIPKCKTYYKSLLYHYFKDQNITWDKKAIKSHFRLGESSDSWISNDKKFVRGVLGVSETQKYQKYGELKITSNEFERVPSPVVFKVFNKGDGSVMVYFFSRDFYKKILNKEFAFRMDTNNPLTLKTPTEFDVEKYLEWAVNEINRLTVKNDGISTFGIVKETDDILRKIKNSGIKSL